MQGTDYAEFWKKLATGEFISNEFVRYGKGGKEIWIQAAYNPIRDTNGKVYKVVKFATDVSERMGAIKALGVGLQALAEGDLTHSLPTPFVPSMEAVRTDFNDAIDRLCRAMQTVGDNANAIASGAREIRSAADDLSKRTEQQAASVEAPQPPSMRSPRRLPTAVAEPRRPAGWSPDQGGSRALRQRRQKRHRCDGPDRTILTRDLQHHRRHRRHRLPDQLSWRSMPASRQRGPARPARVLPSSPRRSASLPNARPMPPRRSRR